jgi:hypothetical protein
MVELIFVGCLLAFGFSVIVLAVSAGLAWPAHRLFRRAYEPTVAFVTAGFVPVSLLIWSLVGFVGEDCCESGPQAQGLLVLMVIDGALLVFAWPLGYRINLTLIERWRA